MLRSLILFNPNGILDRCDQNSDIWPFTLLVITVTHGHCFGSLELKV